MRKLTSIVLSCILLIGLILPMAAFAADTEGTTAPWSDEYSRIMDITDSLSKDEILSLHQASTDILHEYHLDVAVAAIPEARLDGYTIEQFAAELYKSCDFGFGDSLDGFMCLYLVDTDVLAVVPMGGGTNVFPQKYLDFIQQRAPSLRDEHGVYGVFYGVLELIRSGLETLAENAAGATQPPTEPEIPPEPVIGSGGFARCGEGSDMPAWFPADLSEAQIYFDADAPRVVDMAGIISGKTEAALQARIAHISELTGKDIVIVTDVSDYGLGIDVYAADFYDYNGYGIGPEHEGILLFLNMDPNDRGGWTVETGSETRALAAQSAVNRLDDFLYETLSSGDYDRALSEWVEDVYTLFTTGIARPSFWYQGGEIPKNYYNPHAPVVVDEWGLLSEKQIAALEDKAEEIRDIYDIPVYFHTTGDRMGFSRNEYNAIYMASMGYEKDAVLFTVENTDGNTVKYNYVYLYGDMAERIPERFRSRIENNASAGSDSYERLYEGQRLLSAYLKNGRVPRSGFYWTMIAILSAVVGSIGGVVSLSKAEDSMETIYAQRSAYSYLDRSLTKIQKIRETLLYVTTSRVYIPPKDTGSRTSHSSGGSSTYRSSYSGHSGSSHTGHGRKF